MRCRTGYGYLSAQCRWSSAGLAALRDLGDFLRSDNRSPTYGSIDHLIAEGISQCGRLLRTFLHFGMNASESGQQVYDGMLIHIAGGRRGEFNHRFGQPSVQPTPSFGHLFPFADVSLQDPLTSQKSGLLDICVENHCVPKIFYTDTAAEYWRGDASLTHTSASIAGTIEIRDVALPESVRRYLLSGAQHSPGLLPITDQNNYGTRGKNLFSFLDYRPLYRAYLENLRQWLAEGVQPPTSAYPMVSDGTAITREQAIAQLDNLSVIHTPRADLLPHMHPIDLGEAQQHRDWHLPG